MGLISADTILLKQIGEDARGLLFEVSLAGIRAREAHTSKIGAAGLNPGRVTLIQFCSSAGSVPLFVRNAARSFSGFVIARR